ncbi:hypothetical protein R1sor_020100 [Riccia sorocarpa]|uniref:1-phosphatidylinositol 4-kinase n=1 Tax=Riccia sorocarpa TaxID=122646 RepID=A0ABD3IEH1_9MARC
MAASGLVCNPVDVESFTSPVLKGGFHKRTRSAEGDIQIFLATLGSSSSVVPMRVLSSDTIASVKMRIQKSRGFFRHHQRLVYGGRELVRDDVLIKDYGVCNGEMVHLVLRLLDVIDVKVKTVSGKEYVFKVWRNNRVRDLKQRISQKEGGLALDHQHLVFNGKRLQDHERIEGLHSGEDVVIHLVVRRTARVRSKSVGADLELSVTSSELDSVIDEFILNRVSEPALPLATSASSPSLSSFNKTPTTLPPVAAYGVAEAKEQFRNGVVVGDHFVLEPARDFVIGETPDSLVDVLRGVRAGFQEGYAPVLSSEGSGGTYFLKNSAGKNVGVFKPKDEEPMAANNPRASSLRSGGSEGLKSGIRVGEGALREAAAYILDHPASGRIRDSASRNEEGFAGVPPTTIARASHKAFNYSKEGGAVARSTKVGSLQQFVYSFSSCEDMGPAKFPVHEVHKISVLDMRLANTDRNGGNILVCRQEDGSFKLVPIDHGYCMPDKFEDVTFEWLYWPQALKPFSPATLDYIAKLDADWDISILAAHGLVLRPECARVFRVATMLLKKGAALGLTPFQIGSMMSRENFDEKSAVEIMMEEAEAEFASSSEVREDVFMEILSEIMDKRMMERTEAKLM